MLLSRVEFLESVRGEGDSVIWVIPSHFPFLIFVSCLSSLTLPLHRIARSSWFLPLCLSLFGHKATLSISMSLSLLRIYSSPHLLSSSLFFPTPPLSSFLPKLPNAPRTPHIVLCHRRDASSASKQRVPEDTEYEQPMRTSYDDDEEEEEEFLGSLVLPERWDVLGLGQAMVILILHHVCFLFVLLLWILLFWKIRLR